MDFGLEVSKLEQPLEFIYAQASILNNSGHRICVYRIRSGNGDNPVTIGHRNVFSLPGNPESCFLKSSHSSLVIYPGQARHKRFLHSAFPCRTLIPRRLPDTLQWHL